MIFILIFSFLTLKASVEVREASKRAVSQLQSTSPNLIPPSFKKDNSSSSGSAIQTKTGKETSKAITLKEQCAYMSTMMSNEDTGITILHFNDVYNIDANSKTEPIGGAARFVTAIKSFDDLEPLVLFSGDIFSPSMCKYLKIL